MVKPLWALAGVAVLGTVGIAGAVVVASSGDEQELVEDVQTPTQPPSASATASPTPIPDSVTPTTTEIVSPAPTSGSIETYTDSITGFSFSYPSDWFITEPVNDPAVIGYGVILSSYDLQEVPQAGASAPSRVLKMDLGVEPNPEGLSAEEWIEQRIAGPDDGVTAISEEAASVDGAPAVKRLVRVQETQVIQYFFTDNRKMYFLQAYPADSVLIGELDAIVASFKLP